TPHLADLRFPVTPAVVRRAVGELARECRQQGIDLEILPGADVRLQPELLDALEAGQLLTLADQGSHLLLELPPHAAPHIEGLIFDLAVRGITPIVTHPERNLELSRKPERLAGLVEHGCLVQVTAAALLGEFGRPVRKAAERFLKAGLVHVVASDAHAPAGSRRPAMREAAERLLSLAGEETAHKLLCENPGAIASPPPPRPLPMSLASLADAPRAETVGRKESD
ncbi:MAG: tyrosine-protein phosphatase, partial [Planctomycetota bacterium]